MALLGVSGGSQTIGKAATRRARDRLRRVGFDWRRRGVQRRVRRRSRPSMPRSVSHVNPSRANAIVMLISSKVCPISLRDTDARVVGGNAGTLSGAILCISRTRIRFRDLHHRFKIFGRQLVSGRVRLKRHNTRDPRGRAGKSATSSLDSPSGDAASPDGCAGRGAFRGSSHHSGAPTSPRFPLAVVNPRKPGSADRFLPEPVASDCW